MDNKEILNLLSSKNYADIYTLARWAYKINVPFLTDAVYDNFETIYKGMEPDCPLFNHSYEDDVEPTELLQKYNLSFVKANNQTSNTVISSNITHLDTDSISQRPVRTPEEAYQWYKQFNGVTVCHSLKIDGVSVRALISGSSGQLIQATSKGRVSDTLSDFTATVRNILPSVIYSNNNKKFSQQTLISLEGVVTNSGVPIINEIYNRDYKNGRSAALGLLGTSVDAAYKEYLKLFAFQINNSYTYYSDGLAALRDCGITTVPYRLDKFEDTGFDNFKIWINDIMKDLTSHAQELDIAADGIVARVNSNSLYSTQEESSLYSNGSIALKFGEFGPDVYDAIVENISLEFENKSSEEFTVKLYLKPFQTNDNKTIRKITGYNLKYIIDRNINVGSQIKVIYQSGCYPLIYGGV